MKDRWTNWIEAFEYLNRLQTLENYVRELSEQSLDISYYTPHETGHCLAVEKMIKILIKKSEVKFTDLEKFILFAAAWTHDLGMFEKIAHAFFDAHNISDKERSPTHIRDQHDESSAWFLTENFRLLLGIKSDGDVKPPSIIQAKLRTYTHLINVISRFHRIERSVEDCPEESFIKGERIRTRLLACILRLADTLHVDTSRFDRNLYDVLQIGEMDRGARLHWLKSFVVSNVYLDSSSETVFVSINLPEITEVSPDGNVDWEESCINFENIIVHDIQEDVLMVRETFRDNSMPIYSQVKAKITFVPGYSQKDTEDIKEVINDLGIVFSPNTSKVIEKAFDSICSICQRNFDRADITRNQIHQLIRYLKDVLNRRSCHVGLAKIVNEAEYVFNQQFEIDEDCSVISTAEIKKRQNSIAKNINQLKKQREEGLKSLYKKCRNDLLKDIENIIVLGYSEMVTNFLEKYSIHHPEWKDQLTIFVLECSAKRRFTSDNDIEYNDGIYYALQLSKKSFKKIELISDTSFASLAYNLKKQKKHTKSMVLFGVNGINEQDHACVHTSGHLMVAIIAKHFKIPIKVIADRFKIGKVPWRTDAKRETKWLTGQKVLLNRLSRQNIILTNYLEDKIPLSLLTEIILDGKNVRGGYQPN